MFGLYYYGYQTSDGTLALNFIIAPDQDTAWTLLAGVMDNPPPQNGISQVGGISCEGPARIMAGYPVMFA